MTDLVEQILAAITATERDAQDASPRGARWSRAEPKLVPWGNMPDDAVIIAGGKPVIRLNEEYGGSLAADHIIRHDPDAVLRRCATDRETVARHLLRHARGLHAPRTCAWCHRDDRPVSFPCPDLRDIADRYGVQP